MDINSKLVRKEKSKKEMNKFFDKIRTNLKSVRVKLFFTLTITVMVIIFVLIILNNFVLESFYIYSKEQNLKSVYTNLNDYYQKNSTQTEIDEQLEAKLEEIAVKNNFDIVLKDEQDVIIYSSDKDFFFTLAQINESTGRTEFNEGQVLEDDNKATISKITDLKNNLTYLLLSAKLDNGYHLYMRIPINSIQESVKISNNFLYLIAGITILIAAIIVTVVSRKFTDPILELNNIAKKMSNFDFSHKYRITDADDEINNLGKSINIMSDKLERTINQLRNTNIELEKDVEEKSKINEMRATFISDVSHELKTPIALIQGYSEGLLENVNSDEESRKFYAEVILDETNKMDKLVKQLLDLMKLEYGKREFDNKVFSLTELEQSVIKKSTVMLEEKNIKMKFNAKDKINAFADDFYIEQVLTNYFTNAVKNAKEIDGEKFIEIKNIVNPKSNKIRITVFNTGNNIKEEELERIWKRFYKADSSRKRDDGGSGIGLSFVKAIMTNYQNKYGVINKENGVEFYFELDKEKDKI